MFIVTNVLILLAASLLERGSCLQQQVNVSCTTFRSEFRMHVSLFKNSDTISLLYTLNNTDRTDNSIGEFDSNSNGIEGNGTDSDPFVFNVTGGWFPDTGVALDSQDEIIKQVYQVENDTIGVHLMSKSVYDSPLDDKMFFPTDVIYVLTCNFSEAHDFMVTSGGLNVTGQLDEYPNLVYEVARLEIIDTATNDSVIQVTIGQNIYLRISIMNPGFATGIYAHSCYLCDTQHCNGTVSLQMIDANGCSQAGIVPKFVRVSGSSAQTDPFNAFTLNSSPYMYFQCSVNFCYGPQNPRCNDYCSATGRRKRQAVVIEPGLDEVVTAPLVIIIPNDGENLVPGPNGNDWANTEKEQAAKQVSKNSTVIVSSVAGMATLAVVGVTLAVVWSCMKSYRKKSVIG